MSEPLSRLSFRSAGESHGPAVVAILEGIPRGFDLNIAAIDALLKLRQGGAGRGGRQRIEDDKVEILGGARRGKTIGSPLCLQVRNRDHKIDELAEPVRPRPGHADMSGCYHWLDRDIRSTLERASARETAARVAVGAVCQQVLAVAGTAVLGFVRRLHTAELPDTIPGDGLAATVDALEPLRQRRDGSRLYTLDEATDAAMLTCVQEAAKAKDTVGGVVEIVATGVVPGLGSCAQWHEKLDSRIAAAMLSIPAIKGVEIGMGFGAGAARGSEVHDAILPGRAGLAGAVRQRASNRAGGLEGGMTNGQPLVVRAAMKPISTLRKPLASVDLTTDAVVEAGYERSDVCAVSACAIVAEAMLALVLADATLFRIGGESCAEFAERLRAFLASAAAL